MSGAGVGVTGGGAADGADAVVVGIDIGGTGTRFVAVDALDRIVARRTVPTPGADDASGATTFLLAGIDAVGAGRTVRAVGIGASGPVDAEGVVRNPHTLPAFTGLPLVQLVSAARGVPCVVEGDAAAAAVAEHRIGAGRDAVALLHVTIGTGIGAVLVRDGVVVRGADGLQPEAGHIDVPDGPAPCYCGRESCWEQTSSRGALQRRAGVVDVAALDALADRATTGDAEARSVFDGYGRSLGLGLRTLVAVHRPDRVVLGGGGARFHAAFAEALRATVTEVDLHGLVLDVRRTGLDDDGGAAGAAFIAR